MIEKIADNNRNTEILKPNSPTAVKEKLDYYRTFFLKIEELTDSELEGLIIDIKTFFNLKPAYHANNPPERLVRISSNNRILQAQGKPLSYLTDISQLLAPPVKYCRFGRCNMPEQQVVYCSMSETEAYWETRPQNGDTITISHWALKPNVKFNCQVITMKPMPRKPILTPLHEIYYHLDDFFVDVYSLVIDRNRPKDYLFSALLSTEMLFYSVPGDTNVDAIIYPSVQKKKTGTNFAIRNDVFQQNYDLIGVETRFILDEYEYLNPLSGEVTADQLISSFGTEVFDFEKGKILYDESKVDEIFDLFRNLQSVGMNQIRTTEENVPKNMCFNMSSKTTKSIMRTKRQYLRNDKLNVIYRNGKRLDSVKYKTVEKDLIAKKCNIVYY